VKTRAIAVTTLFLWRPAIDELNQTLHFPFNRFVLARVDRFQGMMNQHIVSMVKSQREDVGFAVNGLNAAFSPGQPVIKATTSSHKLAESAFTAMFRCCA